MNNSFSRISLESLHAKIASGARHFSSPTSSEKISSADMISPPVTTIENQTSEIAACTLCYLAEQRKNVVVAAEHRKKRIMLVSDFPGIEDENTTETLFSNANSSHNILHRLVERMGCGNQTHRSFAIRCVPRRVIPENGVSQCNKHTLAEIAAVDPDYIICCGHRATRGIIPNPNHSLNALPEVGVLRTVILSKERTVLVIPPPRELELHKEWRSQVWELLKQEIPAD